MMAMPSTEQAVLPGNKRKRLVVGVIVFAALAAAATVALVTTTGSSGEMPSRIFDDLFLADNVATFQWCMVRCDGEDSHGTPTGGLLQDMNFTMASFSVSDGCRLVAKSLNVYDVEPGKYALRILAERWKTERVANDFKAAVGTGAAYGIDAMGDAPSSLNFMLRGTFNFLIKGVGSSGTLNLATCENMVIGQGSTLTNNNWWLGGPNCKRGSGRVVCPCSLKYHPFSTTFSISDEGVLSSPSRFELLEGYPMP